jgi:hypothetical protein
MYCIIEFDIGELRLVGDPSLELKDVPELTDEKEFLEGDLRGGLRGPLLLMDIRD